MIFSILLGSALFTSICSALHGANIFSKGIVMGSHAFLLSGICYLTDLSYFSFVGIFISLVYWFTFRTSKQARSELDCIRNPSKENIIEVMKSYIIPLSITSISILLYSIFFSSYIFLLNIPLLILISIGFIIGTMKIFNYETSIGKRLKEREHQAFLSKGHADGVIENRSMQEIILGLIPSGLAIGFILFITISGIKHFTF